MRTSFRLFRTLVIGLALGLAVGFYVGWVAWPAEFTDAPPSLLQETYRRDYTLMIATAYAQDGDLPRAQQRLTALGENASNDLYQLTLSTILAGGAEKDIRVLARLATDLGFQSPAMTPYLSPITTPIP